MKDILKDNNSDRVKALIFLVVTAILWSTGGFLIKLVPLNPIALAGIRSGIASVVLLVYIRRPRITWSFWQLGGAFFYVGTVFLFVSATKLTTAANAILLQYTAPVFIALFGAWILKEKPNRFDWLTIIFVMAGMLLFFMDSLSKGDRLGNILAILSGACFGLMVIFMRKQKDGSPLESAFLGNILTFILSIPFLFDKSPGIAGWTGLLLMGFFQLGLTYILYSFAIKHVTALEGVLIPVIEPILNPLWTFLIIGEIPGLKPVIGGIIIIGAVTLRYVMPVIKNRKAKFKEG